MSPFARKTLPPRILVLVGVVAIVAANFMGDQPTVQAALRIGGGLIALGAVIWFVTVSRAARRG